MDSNRQNTPTPDNGSYSGYSSYQQNGLIGKSDAERSLEREMMLQEFKDDREVIIQSLKTAIKNGEYDEARDIVHQYRAAIKTDEQFAVLAQMVKEKLDTRKEIEVFETQMDCTPDDDYRARLELCKKILRIQKDNKKYLAEKERCEEALGISKSTNAPVKKNNKKDKAIDCPIALGILGFLDFSMVYSGLTSSNSFSMVIGFIITGLLHVIMLSNFPFNPLKNKSSGAKIGLSVLLFFVIGMALV